MNRFKQTALSCIDSYKIGHVSQYPEGITKVYSNFTPRSASHFNVPSEYKANRIVWFGLQAFLMEMAEVWQETFFDLSWDEVSEELDMYIPFCGPNGVKKDHFKQLHDLGYLPLEIKAIAEGTEVPIGVPVLTITNTAPEAFWLVNFMETWMSCAMWQASTSATISRVYRKILEKYADKTGGAKEFIDWQLHDFSARGMGGIHMAAMSGAGHLLSATGTDNLPAVKLINDCYAGKETFVGGSVPATEHSVMCAGGKESEIETFRRLIQTYPSGVVSIVSDTWDFWNVVGLENSIAMQLKEEILARTPDAFGLAKVVFRPDSGDPVKIITGYDLIGEYANEDEYFAAWDCQCARLDKYSAVKIGDKYFEASAYDPGRATFGPELRYEEVIGAVECLAEIFGTTTNTEGFRTLNQRVGLIYGDSITPTRAEEILSRLMKKGYASDNIVFGIGSYTFQYNTRDTFGWAVKSTYVEINGVGQEIFKDPVTDGGMKKSARGLLRVDKVDGKLVLKDQCTLDEAQGGELNRVYLNGHLIRPQTFENIRNRLKNR